MEHRYQKLIIMMLLASILLVGCTATYQAEKTTRKSTYHTKIGTATSHDIKEKTQTVLTRYQYQIVRFEETSDEIYIETQWSYRTPFEDEYNQGVVNTRSRIIILTNPRTRAYSGGADFHVVNIYGENEVRLVESDSWITMPLSQMALAYFKKFAEDLKTELSMGIRTY